MKAKRLVTFGLLALVAVASGVLLAQEPQAVGTWAPLQDLANPLSNGAAVALADGRTLIAGGLTTDGTATDAVTIYDSVHDSVVAAGVLVSPRSGHTASLLKDGRVLIVGGVTGGLISTDIEMFDPATGTSVLVGQLAEPRQGHVAAALPNGTVLIAGGATTDGLVLQSAAIFDPETFSVMPLTTGLEVARVNASATTVLDGRVLIAGGSNGSQDLASAEIFESYYQSFAMAATPMSVPRQGHSAVMLPHNGGVLFAGGTSNGAAAAGTDLFLPAVFPDPFFYGEGEFTTTGAMAAPRAAAVAGPTSVEGYAFAATVGAKDAEVYRFATIKTDKDDYAPGEKATITGSGWQAGEEVTLLFQEDPAVHDDYELVVKADSAGNIFWNQWAPEHHDLGVRFYLTATGSQSRAQMTFTDGLKVGSLTVSTQGDPLTSGIAGSTSYTVTVGRGTDNGSNGAFTAILSLNTTLPTGVNATFSPSSLPFGSKDDERTATLTLTSTTATPPGTTSFTVRAAVSDADFVTDIGTLHINQAQVAVTAAAGSGSAVYDGTAKAPSSCVLTPAAGDLTCANNPASVGPDAGTTTILPVVSGTGLANYSITHENGSYTIDKAPSTVTVTCPAGPFSYTGSPLTPACTATATGAGSLNQALTVVFTNNLNAGTATASATFLGDANHTGNTGSTTFTIGKATTTTTVTCPVSVPYNGDPQTPCSAKVTGSGAVDQTLTVNYSNNKNAGTASATASYLESTNYLGSSDSKEFTIAKANPVIDVKGYSGTYDGDAHGATGSATGVKGEDLAGLDLGASFTDVPGGTANWTFTDATGNYNSTEGSVAIDIAKANPVIDVKGYSGTYDGDAHGATGLATGVKGEDLAGLDLGASFTDVPGGTANWTFTAVTGNYDDAHGTAPIVISKADATVAVQGGTYTYDGKEYGAHGTATGVKGEDLNGLLTLGETFTNVPGGTAHWSFAGNGNYNAQSGSAEIVINKAKQTIVVATPAPGQALYNTTFTVAAVGGGSGNAVTFSAAGACTNVGATFTMTSGYGDCTVTFNQAGNGNYEAAGTVVETVSATAWQVRGFYQPVTSSAPDSPVWNVIKGGSTVPLKFQIFAGVDGPEQTALSAVKSMLLQPVACTGGAALTVESEQLTNTGGTSLRYEGSQFIQNWKTPKTPGCFMVTMQAADASTITAYFQVK